MAVTTVKLAPFRPSAFPSLIFTAPQMRIGPATHAFIIRPSMQHIKFCSLIPNCTFVLLIKHSLWGIVMRMLGFANLIFFSLTLCLLVRTILGSGLTLLFCSTLEIEIKNSHHCALTFYKSFLQLAKRTRIQFVKKVLLYFSILNHQCHLYSFLYQEHPLTSFCELLSLTFLLKSVNIIFHQFNFKKI